MKTRRSIAVPIANQQRSMAIDRPLLRRAVRTALAEGGWKSALVSLAIVDDATMARLNEKYLQHTGPTDVLSFVLDLSAGHLEAELVVDAETALRTAPRYDWPADRELLLYVVHGALHLAGYDDATARLRAKMRVREREVLASLGVLHDQ